jgi:hypothetical protein
MNIVYRKTAKGIAEIETRAHRLVPRLRSALILVDGRKSDDELSVMILNDPAGTLATLLNHGFIEVLATLADTPLGQRLAQSSTGAPARHDPGGTASFDALRRDAVRQLNDQLGPHAESLAVRIERTKTLPELQPLLVQGAQILKSLKGSAAAEAFTARFIGAPHP